MTKTKAFLQKHRWSLTGALLGALVFLVLYGVRVLDPVCVDWILNNPSPDPSQHYLGWVFYRRSGWHLPYLGANYSAIYPYRTSILYTDSIPLLAVVCKLLGGVLPARFQYLGLWGLFCYAMQGGLAQALIARIGGVRPQDTAKNRASVLGAGVLVLFPALNIRMFAHTALAANWLVLLAQLYMEGVITFGSLFAGLTAGAGVGLAVLWRVNPSWKQNLFMTGLLWAVGAAAGMVLQLIF